MTTPPILPDTDTASTPTTPTMPTMPAEWQPALAHSFFLRQLLDTRPDVAAWLAEHWRQPLDMQTMRAYLDAHFTPAEQGEEALCAALRGLRQRVMAALIVRDLGGLAPLAEVMESMTQLAELTTNTALAFLHRQLAGQYGEPLDRQGRPQRLIVVGMGKLGGRELNVSSDVDFIFIYPEDGETAGAPAASGQRKGRSIEAYEFFVRLGKRLIAMLDEITGDGRVFRVDMRLRPNGDAGPLVCSFVSLENYLITQGREWERYAWIRARILNTGENHQPHWTEMLEKIVRPFIYRKYLDFGAINAMRDLHAQIRREVVRKDRADHIKLGPGGIREIEFIAQVFQLIRGGRDGALQVRPTLTVLARLIERCLLSPEGGNELLAAYAFLRRLEHRLQYVNDEQTHRLPTGDAERAQIARSMGFSGWPAFAAELETHRARVARHFSGIFSDSVEDAHPLDGLWREQIDGDDALESASTLGFRHPKEMLERLHAFRKSAKYQQLPTSGRERLDALGPRLIEVSAATRTPDATWQRGLDFFETISRRGAYLALLQEYPQALRKLAEIIGSSAWAATYLTRHPILLDEILDPHLYETAIDWPAFRQRMAQRLAEADGDAEREMDILREEHHAQVFRLLAQDIAGLHTVEQLADHLTELADIIVQTALDLCWEKLRSRHPQQLAAPRLAVIAYGKLGGKELGYGSDLDLVLLHDDPEPGAGELYARLGQRLSNWLSAQTPAGQLFDVDYRLRPNGDAGMLVNPIEAFRDYQLEKAWTFEHQALTRARFCAGDAALGARFEALRTDVLRRPRDLAQLKDDVLAMRQRIHDAHASHSEAFFDFKRDAGGLVDVEFTVQYLVLGHAHRYEPLCGNLGNIALLGIAAELGLIPENLSAPARAAYREYRRIQHHLRLDGITSNRVEREAHIHQIEAIRALWSAVFDA